MGSALHVRSARPADVDRILGLQDGLRLDALHPDIARRRGFLVSGFERADYERWLGEADAFFVGEIEGEVRGFVLAYGSERIGPGETVNLVVRERAPGPFVLIKQVAVDPEASGHGIGAALYARVAEHAGARPQYAAIVLDPPNEGSIDFHERLGFAKAFEVAGPDGRPRGIWLRPGSAGGAGSGGGSEGR